MVNTFSTVMLIVVMMFNFYLIQSPIASDGLLGSISSYYTEGDTISGIEPNIEITADEVKKEGERKVIFAGSVVLYIAS